MRFRNKVLFFSIFTILGVRVFSQSSPADPASAVASRNVDGIVLYYTTLHEAFEAASGISIDNPDEITLLADITVYAPLELEDSKHIRLVPGNGNRTISRGSDLLDFPVIWVNGENASLTLGLTTNSSQTGTSSAYQLIIDGGYLNNPPIIANTPLAAVSGPDSKLIMYDGVMLQNNNNSGIPAGTSFYENGSGVFIRTAGDHQDRLAEFIMRGGIIQGNINNVQSYVSSGGAVLLAGFGLFTMEGGVIQNNTALHAGGGVHLGSRASFTKTGGIVYGSDAPEGLRNIAINGMSTSPNVFGHAVNVAQPGKVFARFRNDTVGEDRNLSYIGHPSDPGIFGKGERWHTPPNILRRNLIIAILAALAIAVPVLLIVRKKLKARQIAAASSPTNLKEPGEELSSKEQKVLELLLTDRSIKEIASDLELTYSGVTFHNEKIYHKLGVKNRNELLIKYRKG